MANRQNKSRPRRLSQDMESVLNCPAAERSILGAILLSPSAYARTKTLQIEDFGSSSNRIVYQRLMDLAETSRPIDITTLVEELRRHGELESIGDADFVSGLLDGVPDNASVEHYVLIVRESAALRKVYALTDAISTVFKQSSGLHEVIASIDKALLEPRSVDRQLERKRLARQQRVVLGGTVLLGEVVSFLCRFVVLTAPQATVLALWIVHTHAFAAADATPYIAITSAEKQSGKTRLLEVLELLVANAWFTGRVTPAVLVRKIDALAPTLLLDETDAAFKGDPEYAQALRGILNSGYRAGATVSMCVGKGAEIEARDFRTFCPKALAGIGDLPDTVADRSIPIRLKRRAHGEGHIERFRHRIVAADADRIRESTAEWAQDRLERLRMAEPKLPDDLSDRQQDCVEPLLAIADAAGGEWPERARRALIEIFAGNADDSSLSVKLLADIKQVFELRGSDKLTSKDLLEGLAGIETSPWAEYSHGRLLSANRLAKLLVPFGICPKTIRIGEATPKGYVRDSFEDAWHRYLRTSSGSKSAPPSSETQQPPQCSIYEGKNHFSAPQHPHLVAGQKSEEPPVKTRVVAAVAVKTVDCAPPRTNWPVEGEL